MKQSKAENRTISHRSFEKSWNDKMDREVLEKRWERMDKKVLETTGTTKGKGWIGKFWKTVEDSEKELKGWFWRLG